MMQIEIFGKAVRVYTPAGSYLRFVAYESARVISCRVCYSSF